jgi:hypothetical protein
MREPDNLRKKLVGIFKEQKLKTKNAEKLKKENQKEEIVLYFNNTTLFRRGVIFFK